MDAEGTDSNEGSFYTILNVSGDASEDDIKKSFRQLAQAYHPDKHTDPALKAHAAAQFTKLQEAYEVTITVLHMSRPVPYFGRASVHASSMPLHMFCQPASRRSTLRCSIAVGLQILIPCRSWATHRGGRYMTSMAQRAWQQGCKWCPAGRTPRRSSGSGRALERSR